MTDLPAQPYISTALHHSIDKLTAPTIDVQHLRRQLRAAEPPDCPHVTDSLELIETGLHELAHFLIMLREEQFPDCSLTA